MSDLMQVNKPEHYSVVCNDCNSVKNVDRYIRRIKLLEKEKVLEIIEKHMKIQEKQLKNQKDYGKAVAWRIMGLEEIRREILELK